MNKLRQLIVLLIGMALAFPLLAASATPGESEAMLLRFPDIHDNYVVFVYAGDIWRASLTDGIARRLTSHEGLERLEYDT